MASLNKVILIGNLGRDPEVRYTKSGSAVANFSVATTDTWKDRDGNRQERTEWHNIVAWAKLADFAQNYLRKGKSVFIEGRLQTRDWTDDQNVKHYKTEIVANNIQFVGRKEDGPGDSQGASYGRDQGGGPPPPADQPGPPRDPQDDGAYIEDDIPF